MHTPRVVTSETPIFSSVYMDSQAAGTPMQYKVVECRRTVYATSSASLEQLDPQFIQQLLEVPEMSSGHPPRVEGRHRSTSLHVQERRRSDIYGDARREHANVRSSPTQSEPSRAHFQQQPHSPAVLHKPRPATSNTPPNTPITNVEPSSYRTSSHHPKPILFYHKHEPHYGFTNFSPHPVSYERKLYPTSEHLFQSFKFQGHRPLLAEHIRTCSQQPSVAFSEARRFQPEVRDDWLKVNVEKMDETLWHKFTQHRELREELLGTGDAELAENSDMDSFWGIGADGKGRNELGKALERLRAKLRRRERQ